MIIFRILLLSFILGIFSTPIIAQENSCPQLLKQLSQHIEFPLSRHQTIFRQMLGDRGGSIPRIIDGPRKGATGERYPHTKAMRWRYIGENWEPDSVIYLSQKEREKLEIFVSKDGRLVDFKGKIIDTTAAETWDDYRIAIYVMDPRGHIYISYFQGVEQSYHSSILAGKAIAAAGEIEVEDGLITFLNKKSGHYHPDLKNFEQLLKELHARGANFQRAFIQPSL